MRLFVTISVLLMLALCGAGVVSGQSTAVSLPTVEQVLQRYVKAVGGQEAIEALTTRECTGKMITDLPSRTPPVHREKQLKAFAKIPVSVLMVLEDQSGVEKMGYDGQESWRQDFTGVNEDKDVGSNKIHWLLNPHNALKISEYFPELAVAGVKKTAEGEFVILEPAKLDKTYFSLRFNMKTGLLTQIGQYWTLEDYREVDGVLFPFRVLMSRKGGQSIYEFSEVKHNVEIDDAVFAKPAVEEE